MNALLNPLNEIQNFNKLLESVSKNQTPILATGIIKSQKSHMIYGILNSQKRPAIIVAENELKAKEIFEDLSFFIKNNVVLYPQKILFFTALI